MVVFLQAEDGIRVLVRSRGLGDVYKRQKVTDLGTEWGYSDRDQRHRLNSLFVWKGPGDVNFNFRYAYRSAQPKSITATGADANTPQDRINADGSVTVRDDGAGFDAGPAAARGHGFVNMADRLGTIGGRLTVSSTLGAGTTIRGEIPLPGAPHCCGPARCGVTPGAPPSWSVSSSGWPPVRP